ncbi:MAG: BatA domain-containing protein, partial [Actinoplanes sp.]
MIRFLQPAWLLALLPVFLVAGFYVWRQFRRRQYAMRFTNVDLLRTLAPKGLGWRRHVSAAAFLLSLIALGAAMA